MQQWGMKMAERMGTKIVKKMDLRRLAYRHVRAVLVTIVRTRSNNDSQNSGGNSDGNNNGGGGGGGGGGNTARKVGVPPTGVANGCVGARHDVCD